MRVWRNTAEHGNRRREGVQVRVPRVGRCSQKGGGICRMILDINDIWKREGRVEGSGVCRMIPDINKNQFGQGFFVRFKHVGGR